MALESFVRISTPLSPPLMPLSSSPVEYAPEEEICVFAADSAGGPMEDRNPFAGLCNGGFPVCAPTMHPNLVSTLRNVITRPCCAEFLPPGRGFNSPATEARGKARPDSEGRQIANVTVDLIQNRRPFKCGYGGCDKTFKNRQTLKMHHKTHYSDDSAPGLEQPQQFLNNSACRAGQNKKIACRCPVCSRTFVGLYELRRHFGRKHSEGEKMHGCRKCGKRFYIEVDLRDHEKLCGEPIECRCGMKFAFKCNLVAHRKTHPECQESGSPSSSSSPEEYPSFSSSSYSCSSQIHPLRTVNSPRCSGVFGEDSSPPALMIPSGVKLEGIGGFPCVLPPEGLGEWHLPG